MNNCYNDREILLISLVIQHNLGCGEKDVCKNTNCWCIKNCLEMLCNHAALHYLCQVDEGVLAAFYMAITYDNIRVYSQVQDKKCHDICQGPLQSLELFL